MMDDSLADVQQERKKMSVEELIVGHMKVTAYFKFLGDEKEYFLIKFGSNNVEILDRNQAHLLKLYLEEYLK